MGDNEEHEAEYEELMPLVVCKSNGGVYEDESFVEGMRYGEIGIALGMLPMFGLTTYECWVPPALIPQCDLLAMRGGWKLETDWCKTEGCEEDWILARFIKETTNE